MVTKYRFRFEEFDQFLTDDKGQLQRKDEMIWVYDHMLIGISRTSEQFVINHYNKNFDKSEYELVDEKYTLEDYCDQWWEHIIETWETNSEKENGNV